MSKSIRSFFSASSAPSGGGAFAASLKRKQLPAEDEVTETVAKSARTEVEPPQSVEERLSVQAELTDNSPVADGRLSAVEPGLFDGLSPEWRERLSPELKKSYTKGLEAFVLREYKNGTIFPPRENIFNALNSCSYDDIKVVILGQDPYHGPRQAHGLAFSVQRGVPPPPSLVNIYKELKKDLGSFDIPSHGNLMDWSRQGVIMLNTTLTVRQGQPNSHAKKGWEEFTDAVIREIAKKEGGVVFLLWGKPAQLKCTSISNTRHRVITSSHPSPLGAHQTAQPFIGSRCFSRCNAYLTELGKPPIDWKISP